MCGIVGFTGPHNRPTIEAMAQSILHRGPDEGGVWEGDGVTLGARRLSIIDIAGGRQPVFNEDGTVVAIFNGEIYNHVELRDGLVRNGHTFRSNHADTETIVHLYEQYGVEFLDRLNGMFAIALWDANRRQLLLARDRLGIKPLYFARPAEGIVFGSEIKALFRHPAVSRDPDFQSLYQYLSLKHVPSPRTAFAGIAQLRPGEYAIVRDGRLERHRWWRPQFAENSAMTEVDAAAGIRTRLEDAVRLQMQSDVPFGAYLSGGVDSSAVVALMSRLSGGTIKTFSLVYSDEHANKAEDRRFAKMMADHYATDHYEYRLTAQEVIDDVEAVLGAFDEPFSGVTSTFFLTKLVSRHVKVALSGDGADETFGSYLPHRVAQPLDVLRRIHEGGRAPDASDAPGLRPFEDRLEYLNGLLARGDEIDRRSSFYLWDDTAKRTLTTERFRARARGVTTRDYIASIFCDIKTMDPLNRALGYDLATLLPDQVLAFVDRLSMAHSVEVRPPFLDHRLVEFASTIPGRLKIRYGREKHALKEAVRGLVPDEILDRRKEGFILPIDRWLTHELRPQLEDTLAPAALARHGLLNASEVRRLMDEHFFGSANHGPRLWNLLMLQIWWERTYGTAALSD